MASSKQIEERALGWLARLDSGNWGEVDQGALSEWLSASTANRVAFLRLEAGWERSARLKALSTGTEAGAVPPAGHWRGSPFFERGLAASSARSLAKAFRPRLAAIAASLVLAVGAGVLLKPFLSGDDYSTPVGGVASIPLSDGSRITLNTASKVHVALTKEERRIELEKGEAFFEVAKDAARPFVVEAGDQRVIAVGTQFSVRRNGTDVQVVVTDGKVRVERKDGDADTKLLAAGAVAHTANEAILIRNGSQHEAEEALSWRRGYLNFDETSLADAVAEFNRYTSRKIRIEDPKLAALKINGKFRSTNSDEFIHLLRSGFRIQARETGETIALTAN